MDISATPIAAAPARAVASPDVTSGALTFERFYDESAESVARALSVTLGDPELAADATNEAMTRAYQRWAKISGYDNPAAWVYRVGLNWSLSWKRRRRRERERPVRLVADHAVPVERDDRADAPLRSLSIERRAVVVCRIYLDWSVEQTAEALDIATGTVKSRLARALAEMRTHMESDEGAAR